jgi:hypothetical protein
MRRIVNATLRLTRPFGFTLLLTLAVLALLIALLEGLARLPWVETHVPTAIGSAHAGIDVKFGEADYLAARDGGLDCIALGSSVVHVGFDPQRFADAYRQQTGDSLTCYNFGIDGMQADLAVDIAAILIERYHPRLLIYGFTLRALADTPDMGAARVPVHATPWIQYRLGSFNLEGWIVEHFTAYRHFLALREWTAPRFQNPITDLGDPPRLGYQPFTRHADEFVPLDYLADYAVSAEGWAGLERLIALGSQTGTTQLLLVEWPVPDHTLAVFNGGPDNYRRIMSEAAADAQAHGVPMWLTTDRHLIPDDGWVGDSHHLHQIGAEIFSAWLGDQVGIAVNAGELAPLGG